MNTNSALSTILTLRQTGMPCSAIARRVGKTRSAVQQAVYRAGLSNAVKSSDAAGKRYDWSAIQAYYDAGHSRHECIVNFSLTSTAWDMARKTKRIKLRPKIPLFDFFLIRKHRNTAVLRAQLLKAGKLTGKCAVCHISEWNSKPLTLQLDHKNGDHCDNRPENVRELCPNCHSQTDTYGSKKKCSVRGTVTESLVMKRHKEGASDLTIAAETGCSPVTVAAITRGWKRRYE